MGELRTKIFISSTCYDLIDLRDEVFTFLSQKKLVVSLSDHPLSEFAVHPDRNSIETCLANVRDSDIFIIILSQRYGPSLERFNYPDCSATHLEYLEAKKKRIPIYMHVRDKLEAEYSICQKDLNLSKLKWVDQKDAKIFDLLREHKSLSKSKDVNNWYWVFKSSVDLKATIANDLNKIIVRQNLLDYIESGTSALIIVENARVVKIADMEKYRLDLMVRNIGKSPSINVNIYYSPNVDFDDQKSLIKSCSHLRIDQSKQMEVVLSEDYDMLYVYMQYSNVVGLKVYDMMIMTIVMTVHLEIMM